MKILIWLLIMLIAVPPVWAGHCIGMGSHQGPAPTVMADTPDDDSGHDCCPEEGVEHGGADSGDSDCQSKCSSCFFAPTALPGQVLLVAFMPQPLQIMGMENQVFTSPVSRLLRPPIA